MYMFVELTTFVDDIMLKTNLARDLTQCSACSSCKAMGAHYLESDTLSRARVARYAGGVKVAGWFDIQSPRTHVHRKAHQIVS